MRKKRHHYVPVAYLKSFVNDDGLLHVARKGPIPTFSKAKPTEAGFRNFYYSQPLPSGGHDNNRLEDVFSYLLEGRWREVIDLLTEGGPPNRVVSELLQFIGFQRVRVPAFREAVEHAMATYAMNMLRDLERRGEIEPPAGYPNILDLTEVKVDPHQSIHAMTQLLRQIGPLLDTLGYVIVRNFTDVAFATSDNPVCYYPASYPIMEIAPYRVSAKGTKLLFPLTPNLILLGTTRDRERFRKKGLKYVSWTNPEEVKAVNRTIARFGYEAIFSRTKLPEAFMRLYGHDSPVLDPAFAGFDPDHVTLPPLIFGRRPRLPKWDRNSDYDGAEKRMT